MKKRLLLCLMWWIGLWLNIYPQVHPLLVASAMPIPYQSSAVNAAVIAEASLTVTSVTPPKLTSFSDGTFSFVEITVTREPSVQFSHLGQGFELLRMEKVNDNWVILIKLQSETSLCLEQDFKPNHNLVKLLFIPTIQTVNAVRETAPAAAAVARENYNRQQPEAGITASTTGQGLTALPISPAQTGLLAERKSEKEGGLKEATLDLSVPESPAFTVLGLTPQTVVRPTSPRDLVAALLNGTDANGNLQTGVALETAPFLLFRGNSFTIEQYRKDPLAQILTRTQLSLATAKGTGENDKSVRVGLGIHSTIFDKGDPRLDRQLTDCFDEVLNFPKRKEGESLQDYQARFKAQLKEYKTLADNCRQQAKKRNWNRTSLILGFAPSWISPKGELGNLEWNGGALWTSFAYGFEHSESLRKFAQLILHLRYRSNELVPKPDVQNQFFKQDSLFLGGRLRLGNPDFAASVEGSFIRAKPEGKAADHLYRLSFGAERRIASDTWFQVSFGGDGGRADGKNKPFVLASFKYAFSKAPTLAPIFGAN